MAKGHRLTVALWVLIVAAASTAVSQPGPGAKSNPLSMTAENLMAEDPAHRDRPGAVMPGDVIRYRLRFTNPRADSIRRVQFTDPIPAGLHYVAGSAAADRDDVTIEFSIDGGTRWSAQPMIEEIVEGRPIKRPAPAAMYTHVRWSINGWLKPNAQVTAELRARLPRGATTP